MPEYDDIRVKDQLGKPDDMGFFVFDKDDDIVFENQPLVIQKITIGNHFTLDHPVNCELDSDTLELDTGLGSQDSHYAVDNPNNTFRWRFRFTQGTTTTFTDGQLDTIGFTESLKLDEQDAVLWLDLESNPT